MLRQSRLPAPPEHPQPEPWPSVRRRRSVRTPTGPAGSGGPCPAERRSRPAAVASSACRTGAGGSTTAGRQTPKPRVHAQGRARLGAPAPPTCCWAAAAGPTRARTSTRPRCRRHWDRPEGDRGHARRGRRPEPTAGRVVGRAPRGASSSRRDLRTSCAGHDEESTLAYFQPFLGRPEVDARYRPTTAQTPGRGIAGRSFRGRRRAA